MSQENVELLVRLAPGPDVDLARLFRDDRRWGAFTEASLPFYHAAFESATTTVGVERSGRGMAGMRSLWLDWLEPWATYRTDLEEAIDLGERVLVLNHSYGRLHGSTLEVKEAPAAIWTVRDGRIARAEFYTDRGEAFKDADPTG